MYVILRIIILLSIKNVLLTSLIKELQSIMKCVYFQKKPLKKSEINKLNNDIK